MFEAVYTSQAVRPPTKFEMAQLLVAMANRNRALGITGVLVYEQGMYFHLLEGRRNRIQWMVDRVALDRRHHSLVRYWWQPSQERAFDGIYAASPLPRDRDGPSMLRTIERHQAVGPAPTSLGYRVLRLLYESHAGQRMPPILPVSAILVRMFAMLSANDPMETSCRPGLSHHHFEPQEGGRLI